MGFLKIAKRWCLSVDVCFRSLDPKINEVLQTSSPDSAGVKTLARICELGVRILVENSDVTARFANFVTFFHFKSNGFRVRHETV